MEDTYGIKYSQRYNKICGAILQQEREKRRITREQLALGLVSRTTLKSMEEGTVGWPKVTGDVLLYRMGVVPDYFEVVASSEELERWRRREDICLLAPGRPAEARRKLREYREEYGTGNGAEERRIRQKEEEQFLQKVEVLLRLREWEQGEDTEPEEILKLAGQAVACTVPVKREGLPGNLWLSPMELEAFLLEAAALAACGVTGKAWAQQHAVWDYTRQHQWSGRMAVRILPQAALVGMKIAEREPGGQSGVVFAMAKEAMELLRSNGWHCYALPLLEGLCHLAVEDPEMESYLAQAAEFRDMFRKVYGQFDYPEYRLWQGICVENTRETGKMLKMLRKFCGKSRAKSISDKEGIIVTERQLEKIEKGDHKPSYSNFERLADQYVQYKKWNMAMVETDSAEVLEMRQNISTLISLNKWKEAEWEIIRFRAMVNPEYPKVRQELLFWDALMKKKKENNQKEVLEMLFKALYCTVPEIDGRELKWWVFQREEIMIACNIADVYRKMDRKEEAEIWFEAVRYSLAEMSNRTKIFNTGYEILMCKYDNFLGDMQQFQNAVEKSEEAILNYLKQPQITCMASAFYRIAWNSRQLAAQEQQDCNDNEIKQKWRNPFQISEALANFLCDAHYVQFLKEREETYLV